MTPEQIARHAITVDEAGFDAHLPGEDTAALAHSYLELLGAAESTTRALDAWSGHEPSTSVLAREIDEGLRAAIANAKGGVGRFDRGGKFVPGFPRGEG